MHIWGGPKDLGFTYKILCIYSCLNFSHLQITLHLMQYTSIEMFFPTAQNSFWTGRFFSASAIFHFTSSTLTKYFPLRTFFFFPSGETKKSHSGKNQVIGRVVHGGHALFGQKLLNTQCGVGRYACKSPIMKWANTLKEL